MGARAQVLILIGHNIVYFGPEKWDGLWRNRHQLMSRFARDNRVLYVEPRHYLKSLRRQWRAGQIGWRALWRSFREAGVSEVRPNLWVYSSPLHIPIAGRFPLDRLTWWLWRARLGRVLRQLGFDRPITWLSRPEQLPLAGHFGAKLVIYHVVDEYLAYNAVAAGAREAVRALEQQLLSRADLVVVVTEALRKSKGSLNPHTYLVPNGVDIQAYIQAMDNPRPTPEDVGKLPKPVIGYVGLIAARLDLGLLRRIALAHPDWSLALVGAVDDRHSATELSELQQIPNIHFLGLKPVERVPDYVRAFDVGVIPYRLDEAAQNASPLKLYDYLAAGKPIVATDFAAARTFGELVRIGGTPEAFERELELALAERDDGLTQRRRFHAQENSWDKRVDQLAAIIDARLGTVRQ